jgi:hypothetical protein
MLIAPTICLLWMTILDTCQETNQENRLHQRMNLEINGWSEIIFSSRNKPSVRDRSNLNNRCHTNGSDSFKWWNAIRHDKPIKSYNKIRYKLFVRFFLMCNNSVSTSPMVRNINKRDCKLQVYIWHESAVGERTAASRVAHTYVM